MGSGANPFVDESISTDTDSLGEEVGELLGNAPPGLCLYCDTGNSGFRIGSKQVGRNKPNMASRQGACLRGNHFTFNLTNLLMR